MSDQPNTDPQTGATSGSVPPSGAPARRTTGGSVRWTPPSPEHLQRMLPQYEVLEIIGQGGMGAVYRAKQISLDRLVAIKILPPEAADDEHQFIQRFKNEARTMARMLHPTIVAVFDFGETTEGQLYFVMEYVDGTDVSIMIKEQGKLLPAHALAITAHVCDALQYAHSNAIIHRDIKPANILLNKEGAIKVADFGLAKMHDPSLTMGLTQSGKTMGTPDFVAPESLTLGMTADHRADLYAIGVMLYQMLTGKIPRGNFKMPSQLVPGLDVRFDAIIQRAMQEDRDERYQSAHEIRHDLDVILTTPEIKAEAAPAQQSAPPPRKPVARGPQPRNDGTPAVAQSIPPTDDKSVVAPKKPPIVPIGIGAAALLGIGAFFLFKSPEPKPQPVMPTQEAAKPEPKPEIVKNEPPKVSSPNTYSPTPTKPVTPAPVVASAPLTGPVNLLALVDAQRDAAQGKWAMTPEGLKAIEGYDRVLFFQQSAPAEYDYEVEFTIENGKNCAMILPLPQNTIMWEMGTKGPTMFAFGPMLDGEGLTPGRTEAMLKCPELQAMRRYRCLVEVRKDSLRALLDGKELLKWSGDFKRLSTTYKNIAGSKRLGLTGYYTAITFHKAELRPPSAAVIPADKPITTTPVVASAPLTGPVNLLALVDVPRDSLEGGWKMSPEGLAADADPVATLLFQQAAPEEYDYEIEFTITGRLYNRCAMVLPLPHDLILWQMGETMSDTARFAFGTRLDGKLPGDPGRTEAVLQRPRLKANRRYRCLVEVRKDSLRAMIDGEEVLKWSGDLKRLTTENKIFKGMADSRRLGLHAFRTNTTFHKAELRPPSAAVKLADKPITTTPVAVAPKVPTAPPEPVVVAPTIPTPPPAAPAGDPRLAQLEAGFKARYETDAQKPFDAAVAALNQSYAANGIPRARAAAQAKGSLADVTALDAEKAALENGGSVPAEDAADTPDSLKTLRNTYRSALAKITADRNTKAIPLYNMYLGALDAYTTELTKANKLDEARKVKALRDDLATKKPEAATVAAAPPKADPPKPFTSLTTKAPEVKTASDSNSRAAAKWLLANGGSVCIMVNGKESKISKEEDIPRDKFDLIELDFGGNTRDLTDEGFQVFNGLKELRRIKVGSMHSPGLSDAAFAFLADNKDLTSVEMGNYNSKLENIGDGLFVHLSGLKKITTLNFYNATRLTGKGMDKLACLPVLAGAAFNYTALTDDALKALGTCTKLTSLGIQRGLITDAGLAALTSASSLQVLNLDGCKNITGEGFAALSKLKSLTKLSVAVSSFGDAEAAAVADIKSLTNISLFSTPITDAGLAKLTALTNLTSINLKSTKVTEAGIAAFKKALPNCRVEK